MIAGSVVVSILYVQYKYSWRPEVFPLPIWIKVETRLQNPKIEIESEASAAICYP